MVPVSKNVENLRENVLKWKGTFESKSCRLNLSSISYLVFIWYCVLTEMAGFIPILLQLLAHHLFARFKASSFFKPIFSVSSSTCFFQIFLDGPHFLLPLNSRSRLTLRTLSLSLLSTCLYHLTPFAVANRSIISFNPSMSICFSIVFLTTTFRLHMAFTMALSIFLKISFSFSFKHHTSLPYSIAAYATTINFIFHFQRKPITK